MQTFNANDSGETIRTKLNANAAEADTEDAANVKKDGSVAFTADQSMGGNQLTNVGEPGSAQDAATKNYVDAINTAIQIAIQALYPVGSVYINAAVATNPATLLGFGTWVAEGVGRVLIGIDATQTEFDTLGETGGEKTHQLTEAELPTIDMDTKMTDPGHAHSGTITSKNGDGTSSTRVREGDNSGVSGGVGFATNNATTGISFASFGSNQAHNNLQPYKVVYMWRRTA